MTTRSLLFTAWFSIAVLATAPHRVFGATACIGDCDGAGTVAANELLLGVNIALGLAPTTGCGSFYGGDAAITKLVDAVNNSLVDCQFTLAPIGDHVVPLGTALTLHLSAVDPQGGPLSFSAAPLPLPANVSLDGRTGMFKFAPNASQVGPLTLTFSASAGELAASETVTITVEGAPPGGETALTGRVLDTNDFVQHLETPIVGATVSIIGTELATVSDTAGRFTLRNAPAGSQILDINSFTAHPAPDGSPYAGFREAITVIDGVTNVVERPFFLPRIAAESLTMVDPGATTTVTNPTLGISMVIPPATARDQDGAMFDGALSISLVPGAMAPAALPENLQPGMLITIQPVGVKFDTPVPISFPNIDGLPPGTEVDLWSLDPKTGGFGVVGTGRVSGDGRRIETISGGIRAADWHFFLPLQAIAEAIANLFNPQGTSCQSGSDTSVSSGELTETHVLPGYRSFDAVRSLSLVYGSLRADPQPIISTTMTVPVRAALPPRISARLSVGGVDQGQPVFTTSAGLNEDANETIRQAVQFDAGDLPTGLYPYELTLTSHYPMSGVATKVADQIVIQNERTSAFGAGWTLSELQRLYKQSDDEVLLVSGDGTTARFQSPLGKWRKRPALPEHLPLPGTRGGLRAIALDDGIHVIGGTIFFSGFGNIASMAHDVYDPKSNSWTSRAPVPDTLTSSSALVVVDGKIYMIGGSQGYLSRVYDPSQDTWEYRANPPGDGYREGHVAAAVGGKIYVIGGANPDYYPGYPIRSYDPASDTWSPPLGSIPIGRFSQAGAAIGDEIYVVGTGSELQIYNPATNTWRRGADLPTATRVPSVAVFEGKLYVLGGASRDIFAGGSGDLNAVQIYDPATDTWATGPSMPTRRGWSGAAVSAGKLYVFGGFDAGNVSTAANEELTLAFEGPPTFPGPSGDFSQLVLNADGSFTRRLPQGVDVNFDAEGRETSFVDFLGKTTSYEYDVSDRVARITDPAGLTTTLNYAGAHLSEVVDPASRRTTFEHDGTGNLTRITDPDGTSREFAYDARHRLISQISKRGFVTTYTYDLAGRNVLVSRPDGSTRRFEPSETVGLADPMTGLGTESKPLPIVRPAQLESAFIDGKGNKTRFTTDGFGNDTVTVDALGRMTRTARNDEGLGVDLTRPDGVRATGTYDGRGNLTTLHEAVGQPEERVTSTGYEQFSQPTTLTDGSGNQTVFSYDDAGNVARIVDAVGTETVMRYDDAHCVGLVTSSTRAPGLPEASRTTYAYDPATCNLVQLTDAIGAVTTFQYDPAGNVTAVTDANGRTTRFVYDERNHITRRIDATNSAPDPACGTAGVTCSDYDAQGNLAAVTSARGGVTSWEYDSLDRVIRKTDPSGHVESVTYDANGNAMSGTDPNGQTRRYEYDAAERQVTDIVPDGANEQSIGRTYDTVGNLTGVMDPVATLTTAYNRVDDLTAATLAAPGAPDTHIDYTRTKNGMRATLAVATGSNPVQSVAYGYDALNRPLSLTASAPASFAYEYQYDGAGRLKSRGPGAGGTGVVIRYEFDAGSRITRVSSASPDGSTVLADFRHAYDALGNVLTAQDEGGTTTYTYDAINQLTGASGPGISETYTYDAVGNRLSKNGVNYTYDVANRLVSSSDGTTYSYDANGNLRTRTTGGATTTYVWNARNQLTRIDFSDGTFATYTYDGIGRRISKRDRAGVVRHYVYDGADLVQELDAGGAVVASYVYETLDHPVSMTRGGATYYYAYDRLGSVVGLTNGAGELVVRYRYDPWGNLLAASGSNPALENPFRFTGREWDAESGLYCYRLRYYDPAAGRFIGRDPLGTGYVYASNSPLNQIDPLGLFSLSTVAGGVAGFVAGALIIAAAPAALAGTAVATAGWGAVAVVTYGGALLGGAAVGAAAGGVTGTVTGEGFTEGAYEGVRGGVSGAAIAAVLGPTALGIVEMGVNGLTSLGGLAGSGLGAAATAAETASAGGIGQALVSFLTNPFTKLGFIGAGTVAWSIEYIKRHPGPNAPCRAKY